jgi:hypothetical protein
MGRSRQKGSPPRRARARSKPTVSEEPVRVAIATVPRSHANGEPDLQPDVELVKAALLYADEVELVGLGMSLFAELQRAMGVGDNAGFDLLAAMDDDTLAYIASRSGRDQLPANWRESFGQALSLDVNVVESLDPGAGAQLRELRAMVAEQSQQTRQDVDAVLKVWVRWNWLRPCVPRW